MKFQSSAYRSKLRWIKVYEWMTSEIWVAVVLVMILMPVVSAMESKKETIPVALTNTTEENVVQNINLNLEHFNQNIWSIILDFLNVRDTMILLNTAPTEATITMIIHAWMTKFLPNYRNIFYDHNVHTLVKVYLGRFQPKQLQDFWHHGVFEKNFSKLFEDFDDQNREMSSDYSTITWPNFHGRGIFYELRTQSLYCKSKFVDNYPLFFKFEVNNVIAWYRIDKFNSAYMDVDGDGNGKHWIMFHSENRIFRNLKFGVIITEGDAKKYFCNINMHDTAIYNSSKLLVQFFDGFVHISDKIKTKK